jgi:pre-mRNA-splicing factor ATP-dependent RNA helicase DHX15/PRP43
MASSCRKAVLTPTCPSRVDIFHQTEETLGINYFRACLRTVKYIHETLGKGDILVFLAGEEEIERACKETKEYTTDLVTLPLYSALSAKHKAEVFKSGEKRKCVFSTNIAETSLTIDGVVFVVDCGFVKQMEYNPRARVYSLKLVPISKAAAGQRAGRAGRTQPGKCFRLYTEEMLNRYMLPSTQPAIERDDLKSTILELQSRGITDLATFDWIDKPCPETLIRGMEELNDL